MIYTVVFKRHGEVFATFDVAASSPQEALEEGRTWALANTTKRPLAMTVELRGEVIHGPGCHCEECKFLRGMKKVPREWERGLLTPMEYAERVHALSAAFLTSLAQA